MKQQEILFVILIVLVGIMISGTMVLCGLWGDLGLFCVADFGFHGESCRWRSSWGTWKRCGYSDRGKRLKTINNQRCRHKSPCERHGDVTIGVTPRTAVGTKSAPLVKWTENYRTSVAVNILEWEGLISKLWWNYRKSTLMSLSYSSMAKFLCEHRDASLHLEFLF